MADVLESDLMEHRSIPPGWSHNPTAWSLRLPVFLAAAAGCGIALYLALYQWGFYHTVWDPVFGAASTKAILESSFSKFIQRIFLAPDAFWGALAYGAECVITLIGGSARWRTMPWIVLLFGLSAAGMGLGSICLVLMQAFWFHAFCFLCLVSAGISFAILPIAFDELRATLQYLRHEKHAADDSWPATWHAALGTPVHEQTRRKLAT